MLLCFSLTSCKKNNNPIDSGKESESLINDIIVFKKDDSLIKYYYIDVFLQKVELVYDAETEEIAQGYISIYSNDINKEFYSEATYKDKQVIINYSDKAMSSYKNFSKEDLITYMKSIGYQVKK